MMPWQRWSGRSRKLTQHQERAKESAIRGIKLRGRKRLNDKSPLCSRHLLIAKGPGNLPEVRVWTATTGLLGYIPVQKTNPLPVSRPNLDQYQSTNGFCQVGWTSKY
jgi:hypothetical protein